MNREYHDGQEDGLIPLQSLDVKKTGTFQEMLRQMSRTAFGARSLGEALDVLTAMAQDPDCVIIVTVSGAMTVAKMGRVLCDMIENGLAHMVISTGAIMAHGLTESIGCLHYKHNPEVPDDKLFEWGYNRVYDTLEKEESLATAERVVSAVLDTFDWSEPACSHEITSAIGKHLAGQGLMPSILGCAWKKGVPVYIPAFTDSELGLDVCTHTMAQDYKKGDEKDIDAFFSRPPRFNPFKDVYDYAKRVMKARKIGIFTIGGGVPRNWAQQVAPFIDIINARIGSELRTPRFQYGIRICPEPVHWGGLSGCTYIEGVSWGKFIAPSEGGRYAEVLCDATIAWPLLIRAALESLGRLPSGESAS